MSDEQQSQDEFYDEVVADFIQKQIDAGEAAGKSVAEIESSFEAASLILTVRMLESWGGGELPEGAELLVGLGEMMDTDEAECRRICSIFIHAGWMDAGYCLTEEGLRLAGRADD